jgi:lysophospholipase L1-like esterase
VAKARIYFVRLLITSLVAALSFAGLEIVLDRYYSEGQSFNWTAFHPERGWALVPGDYFYKPPRDMRKIPIHINPFGFRTRGGDEQQRKGRTVMVLGDSFVFGRETPFEDSFPARMEVQLNQRVPEGVQVLNAGVPGYGTSQELLYIKELAEKHQVKSDIYLLMFFTNDTLDNLCLSYGDLKFQPVRPCFTLGKSGELVFSELPRNIPDYQDDALVAVRRSPFGTRTLAIARSWAEERLQTENELVELLGLLGLSPRLWRMPGVLNAWYYDRVVQAGVPLTAALIGEMKRQIESQGGQLLVSMVPSAFQMYPETYIPLLQQSFPDSFIVDGFASDTQRPQRIMRDLCMKAGVPFLDLFPALAEHRSTPLFIPRDGHLTPVGHKLASEVLLPFVLEHMPKQTQVTHLTDTHAISNPD